MNKPTSSKKVQRAVRAAASSRGAGERRELGFPLVVLLIVVLGVALVVISRASRESPTAPRVGSDHWHSAYAFYDCDHFLEPFTSSFDPDGIHSHNDGVIHIHPFNSSAAGERARLGVFFNSMGARVDEDEMSGPGIGVLEVGSDCNGQPTVIRAGRFDPANMAAGAVAEYLSDFEDVILDRDLEAFTFARIPADAEIPPPPGERMSLAISASGQLISTGPVTDADPGDAVEP